MSEPVSKNAAKKAEKERKKEEAKAARAAERAAKESAAKGPAQDYSHLFAVRPLNQSQTRERRVFTNLADLGPAMVGQTVLVRARVDSHRRQGNLCFVVLRQRVSTAQCVVCKTDTVPKEMVHFANGVTVESMVDVEATVAKAEVKSCTVQQVELVAVRFFVVSAAAPLPIQVSDCSVPPAVFKAQRAAQDAIQAQIDALLVRKAAGEDVDAEVTRLTEAKAAVATHVKVSRKLRLDNRVIDLRTRANNAIFRIQSGVQELFREYLLSHGSTEIHSPKLLGAASEGGASVFKLQYFDRPACLAQSPQFYKQMAIAADFGSVFEIGPIFRAEKSNTRRHLCEFNGLDLEMAFNEHYHEVTDVIGAMFVFIFDELPKRYAPELAAVNDQYPFKPIRYQNPPLRFEWPQIIQLLRENGETIGDLDDLSTPQETLLGEIIAKKYDSDFYWVDKYPADIRPFYSMVDPANPQFTNSYDWFVRGWEIISGAQRIHEPELLTQRCIAKGVDPATVSEYIDAFRYGCPPHGGCGIGLERLVMLYLGLKNIRQSSLFPRDPLRIAP